MPDAPLYLTGLARDVIEHAACEGCKVNAAQGLDELGLLVEFLDESGLVDPRSKSGAFAPSHAESPTGTPRERSESVRLTVTFSLPDEETRESARRKIGQVTEAVKAALVGEGASVARIQTSSERPSG